jgi:hypothetical protein
MQFRLDVAFLAVVHSAGDVAWAASEQQTLRECGEKSIQRRMEQYDLEHGSGETSRQEALSCSRSQNHKKP